MATQPWVATLGKVSREVGECVTLYEALWRYLGWLIALSLIFGNTTLRGLEGGGAAPRVIGLALLALWGYSTYSRLEGSA